MLVPKNPTKVIIGPENSGEPQVKNGLDIPGFIMVPRPGRAGIGWDEDQAVASGGCGWGKEHPKRPQVALYLRIRSLAQ